MVNAVMDAIALLSSLATDLDIMLNDLRSSGSSRLLPNNHNHQHHIAASTSINTVSNIGGNSSYTTTGYLHSALRGTGASQQQSNVDIIANTNITTNTGTTLTNNYNRYRYETTSSTASSSSSSSSSASASKTSSSVSSKTSSASLLITKDRQATATTRKTATTIEKIVQQNEHERKNEVSHKLLRARNINNANGNDNKKYNNTNRATEKQASKSAFSTSNSGGLSPEVRQVQKLPLRQKLLQHQPQKVHVQLLQRQQRATKSMAMSSTSSLLSLQINQQQHQQQQQKKQQVKKGAVSGTTVSIINRNDVDADITMSSSITAKTSVSKTVTTSPYWLRSSAQQQQQKLFHGLITENDTNRSSDPSGHQQTSSQTHGQHQLKSLTTATGKTTLTSNNNNNNNNNKQGGNSIHNKTNNNNNNNNNINHRRLPFCGLDSIKGSDKNEDGGVGGNTNLSFDLNSTSAKANGGNSGNDNTEQFHSLDAHESSCCGDEQFEDDMQALLPKCNHHSRDELSQSRTSLVSSSDGGILAEGETSSETSRDTDDSPPCSMGLVERLLLTHPVWFLPGIQRSGAVHFLQGKEEGNFIVRGSSQPNTMAVSVRLPPDTGPYIEHYLIQSNDGILSLESSRFKFDSIPALIAHYAQCCDELPVQLVLPRALRDAKNRQQLSSLALLGQEFWRYPMSLPKTDSESIALDAKSPNSLTETSGLGTTVFSNSTASQSNGTQHGKLFSNVSSGLFSQAGTPSDCTSSVSSFTTSGGVQNMQLMSPESVDSVILTMSPVDAHNSQRNGVVGLGSGADLGNAPSNLSTFRAHGTKNVNLENGVVRPQRPKPPNTLNLDMRKPPAPPLRWSKPLSPKSPTEGNNGNFTVTTTVTFSVDKSNSSSPQFVEVTTPATSNAINTNATTFQTFSKRLSPEGECKDTLSSQGSSSNGSRHWQSQSSKDSNSSQRKILSPGSAGTPSSVVTNGSGGSKSKRSKARKESKHYQESNILESPLVCCRSKLIDKISDYEDLWTNQDQSDRTNLLSSFKPSQDGAQGKRPDLLAETPTITSLNANLLSPANSTMNSVSPNDKNNSSAATPTTDAMTDSQQLIHFSSEAAPRSRAGLMMIPGGLMSQSLSEEHFKGETTTEGEITPTAITPISRSKQGSPFYAEPADALRQAGLSTASILRRSQRGPLLPANHRHSEPPKGGMTRTPMCPVLAPSEIEKIAGSLDELKKKQQQHQKQDTQQQKEPSSKRARGRLEQWQLDSSWEFMGKRDEEDVDDFDDDDQRNWKQQTNQADKENQQTTMDTTNKEHVHKPITIHQIIAKRLPDLNLPELVRCSTPPQNQNQQNGRKHSFNDGQKTMDSQNSARLSSYDNVERNYFSTSYFNGHDSGQSDDGTVFSEPWDSSQWDSFMPTDDTTASDTIHFSRCRAVVSEDDTIIDELSTKENHQDTLKAKKAKGRQKVATILRNQSMRDREILCHPRNKVKTHGGGPGDAIRSYTLELGQDHTSTFSRNIENFISCTKESREAAPQVVMRNMRQFMNGMKNYLVKHGEGKFLQEVETARSQLKSDEFLNIDAILETVMHQLVVLPLREHLYGMFVDYYTRSEDIQLLAQNVKYACGRCAADFGIRNAVSPPSCASLAAISNLLLCLQEAELPLEKLDIFLSVISKIVNATCYPRGQQLGADDFLPILVYVVAKCGFVGAEIEAEFMWGLLQPQLLNGEPGYYLTAMISAVHVLKSFMASENESGNGSLDWRSSSLPACSSVLRVIIPDECNGSLQTRTLPVRPHTTTREVCRIIAHKARITNPQDFALFKLVDGEETLLSDLECPQDIRLAAKGKHCMLAYKRIEAKIAWPTATQPNFN